jgi:3-mercaptopyruvate sulfurtransferase SseA
VTKRSIVICALAILAVPLAARLGATAAGHGDDLAAVPRVSQAEFKKALASGGIRVLDVRDAVSYANGHIPGAESIPLDELAKHMKELTTESRSIVTYCA